MGLKDFLSHIETKRELTIYLSNYVAVALESANNNNNCVVYETHKKDKARDIDIGRCFDALEPKRAKSLLGFHALTCSDMTAKFRGRSKAFCWKVFLQSDDKVLDSFSALVSREIHPTDCFVVDGLVKYVIKLYCSGCPADIDNLGKLRWFMLGKYQTESEKNPPMLGALIFIILRSHYISLVWRTCDESKPSLPSPCEFGWRSNNDSYEAVTTKELPAPEALIELIFCGCTTKCKNNRCRCFKADLVCTETCNCLNCENCDQQCSDCD